MNGSRAVTAFGTFFGNVLADVFTNAVNLFKWLLGNVNILDIMWTPALAMVEKVSKSLADKMREGIHEVGSKIQNIAGTQGDKLELGFSDETEKAFENLGVILGDTFRSGIDVLAGKEDTWQSNYKKALAKIQSNLTIIGENTEAIAEQEEEPKSNTGGTEEEKKKYDVRDDLGQVGAIMKGGILGFLEEIVKAFIKPLMAIENVGKVFNFLSTIFEKMFSILQPLINQLFAPLVVILEIIGEILASVFVPILELAIQLLHPILDVLVIIFQVLAPIISAFSIIINLMIKLNPLLWLIATAFEFVGNVITFIYNNILRPIINFFGKIFVGIYNFIISIWNAIANFLNGISIFGWHPFNLKTKKQETWTDLTEISGENDYSTMPGSTNETSGSGSGSYSAAKDVIVNIYFNHSFVNGDARTIALALEAELESAHALGYT
jgi:hypothetical protein